MMTTKLWGVLLLLLSCGAQAADAKWLIQVEPHGAAKFQDVLRTRGCVGELLNPNLGKDMFLVACAETSAEAAVLNADGVVKSAPSFQWKLPAVPPSSMLWISDPLSSDQWALDKIRAWRFWLELSRGDKAITVAIIDSGVDVFHEDLADNIAVNTGEIPDNGVDDDGNGYVDDVYGWNTFANSNELKDTHEHGTHIAGVIGATVNNNIGVAGLNWFVSMVPIKFFGPRGEATTEGAIRAIDYAVARGARIINVSWGGPRESPLLKEAFARCAEKNILVVAAAGNEAADNDVTPTYPANYALPNLISVASSISITSSPGTRTSGRRPCTLPPRARAS